MLASIHVHSPLARYLNEDDEFWFILNLAFFFNDDDGDDNDDYDYFKAVKVDVNFKYHFCFLNLSKSKTIKGEAYNLICLLYFDYQGS